MVKIKLLKSEKDAYHKQMLMNSKNDAFGYTYRTRFSGCLY